MENAFIALIDSRQMGNAIAGLCERETYRACGARIGRNGRHRCGAHGAVIESEVDGEPVFRVRCPRHLGCP
jgi:hypothetical protein